MMRATKILRLGLTLAAGLLLIQCGNDGGTGPGRLATIVVTPGSIDTLIGASDTVRLTATARDANGSVINGVTFTWASSNQAVATVNSSGLVTAVANGTSTITASEPGGVSGSASFKSATIAPTLVTSLNYNVSSFVGNHPMSTASNGSFYYTISDGTAPAIIKRYTLAGAFIDSSSVNLDARALLYAAVDGNFYVKIFGTDWYRVNPTTGASTLVFPGMFANFQSSPAISADGATVYEHENGTVRVLSFATGQFQRQLTGFATGGYPSSEAIAADASHLFTWDGSTAYMYDLQGRLITSFTVPNGTFGFSLSYANGLLWTTSEVTGTSTWYGYRLLHR